MRGQIIINMMKMCNITEFKKFLSIEEALETDFNEKDIFVHGGYSKAEWLTQVTPREYAKMLIDFKKSK